jgi:hypothetical protein
MIKRTSDDVAAAGIDVPLLAATLQSDGARPFVSAWEGLMHSIKSKAAVLAGAARVATRQRLVRVPEGFVCSSG